MVYSGVICCHQMVILVHLIKCLHAKKANSVIFDIVLHWLKNIGFLWQTQKKKVVY